LAANTPITIPPCAGVTGQGLQFTPVPGGYKITFENSALQLNVAAESKADYAEIIQWPFAGGANETWNLAPTSDGYETVVNLLSGKCLTAVNGFAQQVACSGAAAQKWSLAPTSSH
jgi:hypothetical protein